MTPPYWRVASIGGLALGLAAWVMVAGLNVNVSALTGEQEEVDLAIDPTAATHFVAGSNDAASGLPHVRVFESTNGGGTWSSALLPVKAPYTYASDPAVTFDRAGNAYFAYVAFNDWYQMALFVTKLPAGASAWNSAVAVPSVSSDKELIAVDTSPTSPCVDNVYVAWDNNETTGQTLRLSRSTNGGTTFLPPPKVNDTGTTVIGASPAAGPDGTVYVAWADYGAHQLRVDKSTDCGATFGADVTVHTWTANTGSDLSFMPASAPKRGVGVFPYLAVDGSSGTHRGRVYLAYNDVGASGTGIDVFMRSSDDQGATWTSPVRVNDDPASEDNDHILPRIAIDNSDGSVHVIFYDTRNDPTHRKTDVYYARSTDGQTFQTNEKVTSAQTDESGASATDMGYGEYAGLAVNQGHVQVLWTDNRGGDDEVYTAPVFNGLAIITGALPDAYVGVAYQSPLLGAGGTPPYTWAATGLPASLSLDPATGQVTGTATAADLGSLTLNVTLNDSAAASVSRTVTLAITYQPVAITTAALPVAQAGVAYSAQLDGAGGRPPYQWSIPSLPAWLTLDAATGALAGLPTAAEAGAYPLDVVLTDSAAWTASKDLPLYVTALPLAIATQQLADAEEGSAYSAQLTSTGGTVPFFWRWTPSAGFTPPLGLGLSSAGLMSGTPVEGTRGTYTLFVTLRDGSVPMPQTVDAELALRILPRLISAPGASRIVDPGLVTLDGSGSSDPLGGPVTFNWTAPIGVTLSDSTSAQPSTTLTRAADYSFVLTVSRPGWTTGASAAVVITVRNLAPSLDVTAPDQATLGSTVTLDATTTTDANGDPIAFSWGQISGPPAHLETLGGPINRFTAVESGDYVLQVAASDGQLGSVQSLAIHVDAPKKKPGCGCGAAGDKWPAALAGLSALLARRRRREAFRSPRA